MSNKLTFEEFLAKRKPMQSIEAELENEIHYAINQFTKHKDEEIKELKKKVEELEKTVSSQTEIIYKLENECSFTYKCPVNSNLQKENESLKKKLEKAEEVIRFYANQENWYSHGNDSTIKRRIDLNDGEEFLNYEYGGKRARAYLKENEQ